MPRRPESATRALVAGPQGEIERKIGFTSAIPAGTTLHSVTVSDSTATVDLSREFASGGGSLSIQERVGSVVFTVTQFPNVEHVRFRLDGTAVSTIGGEGLLVDNVDRATSTNVTPLILVESPTPGQAVRSPRRVRGMSNTFEATVNHTLTDPNGTVLAEGYATATAGTGTRGTFSFDVPSGRGAPGSGISLCTSSRPRTGLASTSCRYQSRCSRSRWAVRPSSRRVRTSSEDEGTIGSVPARSRTRC